MSAPSHLPGHPTPLRLAMAPIVSAAAIGVFHWSIPNGSQSGGLPDVLQGACSAVLLSVAMFLPGLLALLVGAFHLLPTADRVGMSVLCGATAALVSMLAVERYNLHSAALAHPHVLRAMLGEFLVRAVMLGTPTLLVGWLMARRARKGRPAAL